LHQVTKQETEVIAVISKESQFYKTLSSTVTTIHEWN